jgi:fructose-1,6-bisphosphatase/inositol monophosphatase family enzyme
MAAVASGGADAFYEFGIHAWDMAAGDILVREAGGIVLDTAGTNGSSNIKGKLLGSFILCFSITTYLYRSISIYSTQHSSI